MRGEIKKCKNARHPKCIEFFSNYPGVKVNIEDMKPRLNYKRCREIFLRSCSDDVCKHDIILDINRDLSESRDILSLYSSEDWIPKLMDYYSNLPPPNHQYIPRIPSLCSSKLCLNIVDSSFKDKIIDEVPSLNGLTAEDLSTIPTKSKIVLEVISPESYNHKSSPKRINMKAVKTLHMAQLERHLKQMEI